MHDPVASYPDHVAYTSEVDAAGTVTVIRRITAMPEGIWEALTDPALVCRWFGFLWPGLEPGTPARFDFGDGDFFAVENVQLTAPYRLHYDWRFLGIGPLDSIDWHITPHGTGCQVTVTDSEPGRSQEAAQELCKGWLDFTWRLQQYVHTRAPIRYDWRREFDGSIELPARLDQVREVLFAPGRYARWLPLDGFDLDAETSFYVEDDKKPVAFPLTDVTWLTPTRVRFQLGHSDWLHPTTGTLEVDAYRHGALLTIHQVGWEHIHAAPEAQRQQRKRFSACWIRCLQRAHDLLASELARS